MSSFVDAAQLRGMLDDGQELALIDVREEGVFTKRHLLLASCIPLSRLELLIDQLVPRRRARIILCDADGSLAPRAAMRLAELGYTHVAILRDGIEGWAARGYALFSGINVPSKAFGEFVETTYGTSHISADELKRLKDAGEDIVILDSRPFEEYRIGSIPGAINVPGVELAYRIREIARSPNTLVVVNCAGRTRSIIGAQSLINSGLPNPVKALKNGTMGWNLAGFELERNQSRRAPDISGDTLEEAQRSAAAVAERFDVPNIDNNTLDAWRKEKDDRTLYIFDVRSPEEFEQSHLPDSISAPGGQLVQATDKYAATRGARLVLVDDTGVRATMAASWLIQMGWTDVSTLKLGLEGRQTVSGPARRLVLGMERTNCEKIAVEALDAALRNGEAEVIDLDLSRNYRRGHIPGAWFAIRARLSQSLTKLPAAGFVVLTSGDGVIAALAAEEATIVLKRPVKVLDGGTRAWSRAGLPLETGFERMLDPPEDVQWIPYDDTERKEENMLAYLAWETNLVSQIQQSGELNFLKY